MPDKNKRPVLLTNYKIFLVLHIESIAGIARLPTNRKKAIGPIPDSKH